MQADGMEANREAVLRLERSFWTGDADFYRANLDDPVLVAFTEMSGAVSREDVAATIKDGARWRDVVFVEKGFVVPQPGLALLTYEAKAERADGEAYTALVSSAYVKRADGWKLAFHQQTPLDPGKA
jgi:hypothetical protein